MKKIIPLWALLALSMQSLSLHTQSEKRLEPAILADTEVHEASIIAKTLEESSVFLRILRQKIATTRKNELSKKAKKIVDKLQETIDTLTLKIEESLTNFNQLTTSFKQEDRTILSELLHRASNLSQEKRTKISAQVLTLIACFELLLESLNAQYTALQSILRFLQTLHTSHRHTLEKYDDKLFTINTKIKRLKMYNGIIAREIALYINTINRLRNFNDSLGLPHHSHPKKNSEEAVELARVMSTKKLSLSD